MHCFSGSAEIAERCVKMGLYVAFGGSLTFKNNKKAPAAAAVVPLDRLLLETDCPYMAPVPHRGKRCHPAMTAITCEKLAEIKGIDPAEMERIAAENAKRLFGV
ncbi:MAG: TatD family hydrolase [Clostridia bacterium]|nr:TatD family hydrolase [Clostridia bacterium]